MPRKERPTVWHPENDQWRLHQPEFEAARLDPPRAAGPWHGHRWFAYDLIRWRSPEVVVELGTHFGPSFFAFCQAVKDGALRTHLHAVDSWKGDPHAGFYDADVKTVFDRIRATAYPDLAIEEHIGLFSEALTNFSYESIDLLHIDGYHSDEAVREDFETWLPKLASNGLVLLHDVAPDTGYGSANYWRELASTYPSFAFPHSFGLGVVFPKGTDGFEYLLSAEFRRWRAYYPERAYRSLYELQVAHQTSMIQERDSAIHVQTMMIKDRDEALRAEEAMISERDNVIREQTELLDAWQAELKTRDEALGERAQEIDALRRELANAWPVAMAKRAARGVRRVVRPARPR